MALDWDDVKAFVAAARAGSLTLAARETGLSQPTLSRRLKRLEVALGGELFARHPDRLVLTPLGSQLIELGSGMAAAAENMTRRAKALQLAQRIPIRISATMSISLFLSEHLEPLATAAAAHRAQIDIAPSRAVTDLAHHQAEIAIRLRHAPAEGPMRVRRIGRVGFTMYEAVHGAKPAAIGLSDNRPPPHPHWVDSFAQERGLPVTARLGEFFLRHAAIRAGLGASLLPCFLGDRDPLLRRLCPPPEDLAEDAFLLVHAQAAATPAVKAVADVIAGLFSAEAALLAGQTVHPPA